MSKPIISRIPSLIILVLFVSLIAYLQWPESSTKQAKSQRITNIRTANVTLAEFKDEVEAVGTTIANEQLLVTTKYADLVKTIHFKDGQKVKKGNLLIQLDKQEEVAKVRELEANRTEAVVQLDRLQDLFAKRATSKSQVDQQEAKTKAIEAQLMSARIRLNDTTIKAPFDGVLGFRQISLGAYVRPGDVITSLDDLSRVKVDFTIPERFLTTISVEQMINATSTAYDSEVFRGKITSIAPRIDPITRTLKIRAEISNKENKLRPGMLLRVKIVRQIDSVLQIPESAVIPIEDKHFVFVVEQGKAVRKSIGVGRRQPGIVEVTSGLKESEQVVIEGTLKLREGSQVNVLEN